MFFRKFLFFCLIFETITGETPLEKEYGSDGLYGNVFPNLPDSRLNYPGHPSNYPVNVDQSNLQGNIRNNGNGNSKVNYPANSQNYPGNVIQGGRGPTGNENAWNNPGAAGLPVNQVNYQPQNPVWNNQQGPGYNGQIQDVRPYPGQNNIQGANYNYPTGNFYPNNNDRLQKLNPNYPATRNNWNNAVNPRVNYPGNPQPYPVNGIQGSGQPNWRYSNERPMQVGYQNYQNQPNYPGNSQYYPRGGQTVSQPSYDTRYPSEGYSGFRSEASLYPNKNGTEDVSTEKAAILGSPVIISTVTPASQIKRGKSAQTASDKFGLTSAQTKCIQDCDTSSEYHPICGSDHITYFNEEKFKCAQDCGVDVHIKKEGECEK